jgi:ABC-type transport system substrate-binding protein
MKTPRKGVLAASVLGAIAAGGLFGATVLTPAIGGAATSSTTAASSSTSQSSGTPAAATFDPTKGGHTANGITEALLTGDTAAKVKAAALAAVPGGTVQRVENDAEGSPYEAHMTKADSSRVTVKVDASFKVTSIEDGPR